MAHAGQLRPYVLGPLRPRSPEPAPGVLRFRASGPIFEVMKITPRCREFETERGEWGRPGGIFTQVLQFGLPEFEEFEFWPAGLLDYPGWRTADPVPTRGQPPEPLDQADIASHVQKQLRNAPALAARIGPRMLAISLTAVAKVMRENSRLLLIGTTFEIESLIALVTLFVPRAMRSGLSFSTWDSEPESLPDFRIHGVCPGSARSGSGQIQGTVVDMTAGDDHSMIEPSEWAIRLVQGYLRDSRDSARRQAVDRALDHLVAAAPPHVVWTEDWLKHAASLVRPVGRAAWNGGNRVERGPEAPANLVERVPRSLPVEATLPARRTREPTIAPLRRVLTDPRVGSACCEPVEDELHPELDSERPSGIGPLKEVAGSGTSAIVTGSRPAAAVLRYAVLFVFTLVVAYVLLKRLF